MQPKIILFQSFISSSFHHLFLNSGIEMEFEKPTQLISELCTTLVQAQFGFEGDNHTLSL